MRLFIVVITAAMLQGCWAVFIPGNLLESGSYCVGPNVKVGDRLRYADGRTAIVKAVYNTSSRCQPATPVKADVEFQ
jgi:hypothetical protein